MPGNSFGQAFVVTTAGESHGPANVVIVDGCPAGLELSAEDLRQDLARRRPGQSRLTTQRDEADEPEILSGVFEGRTTGTSIAILIRNADAKSRDYDELREVRLSRSSRRRTSERAGNRLACCCRCDREEDPLARVRRECRGLRGARG
jgi:chorismate synthase